jgi:hypothetical protein
LRAGGLIMQVNKLTTVPIVEGIRVFMRSPLSVMVWTMAGFLFLLLLSPIVQFSIKEKFQIANSDDIRVEDLLSVIQINIMNGFDNNFFNTILIYGIFFALVIYFITMIINSVIRSVISEGKGDFYNLRFSFKEIRAPLLLLTNFFMVILIYILIFLTVACFALILFFSVSLIYSILTALKISIPDYSSIKSLLKLTAIIVFFCICLILIIWLEGVVANLFMNLIINIDKNKMSYFEFNGLEFYKNFKLGFNIVVANLIAALLSYALYQNYIHYKFDIALLAGLGLELNDSKAISVIFNNLSLMLGISFTLVIRIVFYFATLSRSYMLMKPKEINVQLS